MGQRAECGQATGQLQYSIQLELLIFLVPLVPILCPDIAIWTPKPCPLQCPLLLAKFDGATKKDCAAATDANAQATNLLSQQLLDYDDVPTRIWPQYLALCPMISCKNDEFPFGTKNIVKVCLISFCCQCWCSWGSLLSFFLGSPKSQSTIRDVMQTTGASMRSLQIGLLSQQPWYVHYSIYEPTSTDSPSSATLSALTTSSWQ